MRARVRAEVSEYNWGGPLKKFYDQLICHPASGIARVKGTWNIDSWRPDVGWWRTILTGCNP